jgi:hypothetical protein
MREGQKSGFPDKLGIENGKYHLVKGEVKAYLYPIWKAPFDALSRQGG